MIDAFFSRKDGPCNDDSFVRPSEQSGNQSDLMNYSTQASSQKGSQKPLLEVEQQSVDITTFLSGTGSYSAPLETILTSLGPSREMVATKSERVRLLTINMFLRPPFANNPGGDFKSERLQLFTDEYMGKYDIICFQEVFNIGFGWQEQVIHAAQQKGLVYHVHCPHPWFFQPYLVDGGLLIVSRFPILASEFIRFEYPAVLADVCANKGLQYAKIDLKSVGGGHLHLFNTHTQSTSGDLPVGEHVLSYVSRYEQIKEIRGAIRRLVFDCGMPHFNKTQDAVLLVGDFNQNATLPLNPIQQRYFDEIAKEEEYAPILPLFAHEYLSMLNALKNKQADLSGWNLVDCLRSSQGQGKFSPVTFAAGVIDEHGVEQPCDPILHQDCDKLTKQALDHVFWLRPQALQSEPLTSALEVEVEETRVEQLPCEGFPFNYCSDHFGISLELRVGQTHR